MEILENKKRQCKKNIGIYLAIIIFTIIVNIPVLLFVSFDIIANITHYIVSNYLKFWIIKPEVFPIGKILSQCLMINIFLLLIIEFVIVWLFYKQLNKIFKIDNLFTMKKFIWLAIITIGIQFIISCIFWWW